ncbi:MAG TPA: TolC family protein [Polyangiaceae bacterium]|nr:TolC family protein [Polyangiaceae bacterium]
MAFAREHHPVGRAALARVTGREAATRIPQADWYPTAGVSAQLFAATANNSTGTYVGPGVLDIPRIGGTRSVEHGTFKPYPSTFLGIGASQELFDFGRIAARTAALDALVKVERQRAQDDFLTIGYDVQEAYFAVFAAKAILKASNDAYDRSKVHRDMADAGVKSGLRSPIELARADADLARFEIGRVRAEGGVTTAQVVFAAAVAVPEARLDIADAPPTPRELPPLDSSIREALGRDPAVLAAVAELEAEEARTRAIGAELRPNLALTATLSGRAGGAPPSGNGEVPWGEGWAPSVPNWDVGVVLSLPLFDGTIGARQDTSRALAKVREQELAVARERDTAAIRRSYVSVGVAREVLPGLARAVDAARANYAQADARFRSGLGTSVELADAEELRAAAEIQLALGQFELARARASFGRAIAEGI